MDVVVIGAGLSGLTAASILRNAGARVQLLEAGAQIGGRIRSVHDTASGRCCSRTGANTGPAKRLAHCPAVG